jgi:hypothetical protein
MAKASRHRETKEKGAGAAGALALLANGTSGRWSVTLDESTEGAEEWFLQIEGPSLYLYCDVDDPRILDSLAAVFTATVKKPGRLVVGRINGLLLQLQWDIEDEKTIFFTVGLVSRPFVRCSIHGQDIQALANATQQAALDLK